MTLAILSSKIAAAKNTSKVDGRCYNIRSQNETKWEVYNLDQLRKKQARRSKRKGSVRGLCSKEEMAEYEQIKNELVALKNKGMTTGNTDNHKHLINIKDVKIDNFTGEEAKFTDFVEDMKTYADVINPELGEVL